MNDVMAADISYILIKIFNTIFLCIIFRRLQFKNRTHLNLITFFLGEIQYT